MSATQTVSPPSPVAAMPTPEAPSVPLTRLVQVELRKLTDTRSGRWLLLVIALGTIAGLAIFLFAAPPAELTYQNFVSAAITPQAILLPILGILTVTSEWGQRTGLITFTLEPRRARVGIAKGIAVIALGLAAVGLALGLGAAGNALAGPLQDGAGDWAFGYAEVRDVLVLQLISVLQGFAFGMLVMHAAGAIVAYFALPTVWGILTNTVTVEWFRDVSRWADLNTTTAPLGTHQMAGDDWAKLAVSVLIWVLVPLVLGWVRLLRRELKSA